MDGSPPEQRLYQGLEMAVALLQRQQQQQQQEERKWFFIDFEDDGGLYEVEVDLVGVCLCVCASVQTVIHSWTKTTQFQK